MALGICALYALGLVLDLKVFLYFGVFGGYGGFAGVWVTKSLSYVIRCLATTVF
jgi:hypothetical protein